MRITEVTTELVRLPLGAGRGGSGSTEVDVVLVCLQTEGGGAQENGQGTGFTYSLSRGGESIVAFLRYTLIPRIVGKDLATWSELWTQLELQTQRLGPGIPLLALAALDIAVWDARARAAQMPLYRLLGATRSRIAVYGSGRSTHQMSTEELVEGSLQYVREGYRAVKLRVGVRPAAEDVARVKAVREAVGEEVRLMVDGNERLDFPTALWLGNALSDLGVYWFEEPLNSRYVHGYRDLARHLPMAVAVGEHLHGRHAFGQFLENDAASILMPDAPIVGGISEWMRVAASADLFGRAVTPHFLPELHIHCALAAPNCQEIEHFPLLDELLLETLPAHQGYMQAPDRPGHGMQWDPAALERFKVSIS